jgi:hypothetical protein
MLLIVLVNAAAAQKPGSTGEAAPESPPAIKSLQIKFKMEAITKESFYMGEVWVAPAKFSDARAGKKFTVEARALGYDSRGNLQDLEAAWKSANPALVKVSPGKGHRVKLTVLKPGKGIVLVSYGGISKKLQVKAEYRTGVMEVEIEQ